MDIYGKGQHGLALLSVKWIGFCFAGKESERNRSGQVRQGVLVFPTSNRKHHGRCYAWSSLMAFVFPRLTCVYFFFSFAVIVHSHEPSSLFRADGCSQPHCQWGVYGNRETIDGFARH